MPNKKQVNKKRFFYPDEYEKMLDKCNKNQRYTAICLINSGIINMDKFIKGLIKVMLLSVLVCVSSFFGFWVGANLLLFSNNVFLKVGGFILFGLSVELVYFLVIDYFNIKLCQTKNR